MKRALIASSALLTLCHCHSRAPAPGNPAPPASVTADELSGFSEADTANLEALYHAALTNADKQISIESDGTAYVKTGDIPAEWLRDSSAQVRPYLFEAATRPPRATLVKQVIQRQAKYLAVDPYANAFRADYTIWERKFELDSLAYPLLLAWTYWKVTGDLSVFTPEVKQGFATALATMLLEQDHFGHTPGHTASKYSFHSEAETSPSGPVGDTGMIWTAFRPSDDLCQFPFLIPSEMMAVQALKALTEMAAAYGDRNIAARATKLGSEVRRGIETFGVVGRDKGRPRYAYEVDGLGHWNEIDDANLPSLLSAPYFGFPSIDDPLYQTTRQALLSTANPFYYTGRWATGIGSPHTPKGMIWPLALIAEGMTTRPAASRDRGRLLRMILASDLGDHHLHEAFDPDDPAKFTRPDFGWPHALFAEFYMTTVKGAKPLPVP